jgi:drug/metabolite transporter (DMT)-like permease
MNIPMPNRLSIIQVALLSIYAVAMAGGQILFKLAALKISPGDIFAKQLIALVYNGYFSVAVVLYAILTVLWVWILSLTPLSRAYPFVALAFAITPVAGGLLFGEPISVRLVFGICLVLGGLLCVAT